MLGDLGWHLKAEKVIEFVYFTFSSEIECLSSYEFLS